MPIVHRAARAGNSVIEFTLVGIPLIFMLISIVEMSRAMWTYSSLAYAVKQATRYAAVHGGGCSETGNSCAIHVSDVVGKIQSNAFMLDPADLNLTLTSSSGSVSCSPATLCSNNGTTWPPADASRNTAISIQATYSFASALAMFWPGAGKVNFGTVALGATSQQPVQF